MGLHYMQPLLFVETIYVVKVASNAANPQIRCHRSNVFHQHPSSTLHKYTKMCVLLLLHITAVGVPWHATT